MDFVSLMFCGRLVDDPQVKTTENGKTICKFSVASNERIGKTGEERTTYIPTVVFGKEAEICGQFLSKGREVLVSGKLETDSYTDKEGIVRKTFSCVVGIGGKVTFGKGGTMAGDSNVEEAPEPVKDVRKAMASTKTLINRNMGRNRPR